MPYNYYQGQNESLSPMFGKYVDAKIADKDREQRDRESLARTLLQVQELQDRKKLGEEGLAIERTKADSDVKWHERYGNLQERQIKVQEDELAVKAARRDMLSRAYSGGGMARSLLSGSTSTDGSQGGGGGPGGSAGGARQPHYLEQFGLRQEDIANLEPQDIQQMQQMGMAWEDQARQNQQAAAKQQADQQEIAGAHAAVDAAGDEAIPKSVRAQMKLRIADAASAKEVNKEVTTALEELHAKEMAQAELDAMIPETEKLLKEARPGDLQGLARLKAFKKVQGHTASDPRKDLELFKKERAEILGTKDPKAEGDKGIDLPGIGMNVNLNTALAKGGTYKVGEDGKPMLPKDIDAELTGLAQQSLRSDPGFANSLGRLAEVAGADKDLTTAFEKMEAKLIDREKKRLLDTFKWEAEPQAEKPKPAPEAPKQSAAPANAPPPVFSSEYPEQTKAIVEMWKTDPEAAIREIVKLRKGTGATSIIDKPAITPRQQRDHPLGGQGPF